jgi:hypothetical protein
VRTWCSTPPWPSRTSPRAPTRRWHSPAFDVPAGFTDGVITFAGVATFPDSAVADFGAGRLDFPISLAAG